MEAGQKVLVLCTLSAEAKRIDDPRYQFDTEEKDGVVVKCTINNAEVLDVPGVVYRLHPNETEKNRLDSLEVLIKDNTKRFSEVFRQLPYGVIKKNVTGIGATTLALDAENNCIVVWSYKESGLWQVLQGNNRGRYEKVSLCRQRGRGH